MTIIAPLPALLRSQKIICLRIAIEQVFYFTQGILAKTFVVRSILNDRGADICILGHGKQKCIDLANT